MFTNIYLGVTKDDLHFPSYNYNTLVDMNTSAQVHN